MYKSCPNSGFLLGRKGRRRKREYDIGVGPTPRKNSGSATANPVRSCHVVNYSVISGCTDSRYDPVAGGAIAAKPKLIRSIGSNMRKEMMINGVLLRLDLCRSVW